MPALPSIRGILPLVTQHSPGGCCREGRGLARRGGLIRWLEGDDGLREDRQPCFGGVHGSARGVRYLAAVEHAVVGSLDRNGICGGSRPGLVVPFLFAVLGILPLVAQPFPGGRRCEGRGLARRGGLIRWLESDDRLGDDSERRGVGGHAAARAVLHHAAVQHPVVRSPRGDGIAGRSRAGLVVPVLSSVLGVPPLVAEPFPGGSYRKGRGLALRNGLVLRLAGDGGDVLMPDCCERNVIHNEGFEAEGKPVLICPVQEFVSFLRGILRPDSFSQIGHRLICDRAAPRRIEGDGVLIDRPLGRHRHILRRHGRREGRAPPAEGIAGLRRIGRSRYGCAVVQRDRFDRAAPRRIEGDGVLPDRPLSRHRHILRRHGLGDGLVPPVEGIPGPRGCGRGRYRRAVVRRDRFDRAAPRCIEGEGVLIDRPLGRDLKVFCGHRHRQCRRPAGEGIAFLRRGVRSRYGCAVVQRDRFDRAAPRRIEGDGVLPDRPLSRHRHILRRHGLGDGLVPPVEGIPGPRGCGRGRYRRAVVRRDRFDRAAPRCIEGEGVLIDRPLGRDLKVFCGHRHRQCRRPAGEGIAFLRRGVRRRHGRSVIITRFRNRAAPGRIKLDRVLVHRPLGIQGSVLIQVDGVPVRIGRSASVCFRIPAGKGIACAGEPVPVQRRFFAHRHGLGFHLSGPAICVEGDGPGNADGYGQVSFDLRNSVSVFDPGIRRKFQVFI